MTDLKFYNNKRVFITGHTGFKGAWMCAVLLYAGADITGYALEPPTEPSLFALAGLSDKIHSIIGDIRDYDKLPAAMQQAQPEIVIHMAAQPIVRESYRDPIGTYSTNVMGTVNLLEAARNCKSVRSIVNVTTDKVYQNNEWAWGYRESDALDGYDPYSNSKSCSELVTACYKRSFLNDCQIAVSTCRAGNVIGGGDFAKDRIVPDCIRAVTKGESIMVRNPYSIRPYQHVLEPILAYLLVAQRQYDDAKHSGCYNIGPNERDCVTTGRLADLFCAEWGSGAAWTNCAEKDAPHEANYLRLDCSKMKSVFGWSPVWNIETAIRETVLWSKQWRAKADAADVMMQQICSYIEANKKLF